MYARHRYEGGVLCVLIYFWISRTTGLEGDEEERLAHTKLETRGSVSDLPGGYGTRVNLQPLADK